MKIESQERSRMIFGFSALMIGAALLLIRPFSPPAAAGLSFGPICLVHRAPLGVGLALDACGLCCAAAAFLLFLGFAALTSALLDLAQGERGGGGLTLAKAPGARWPERGKGIAPD